MPKNKPSVPRLLNSAGAARFFGVAEPTVSNWLDAGMPALARGRGRAGVQLDLTLIAPWVAARRAERPTAAAARLQREQADKLSLQNARTRRELIPVSEVQRALHKAAAALVLQCDALPSRIGGDPAVQAAVRREVHALRSAFADALEALGGTTDAQSE
jgi:phage terminase Nu1 subunit (DNA packaging protein)